MFANGYSLYAFDLTSDDCGGEGVHLIHNDSVTIEGSFKTPLANTNSAVVFSEFEELVQIREDRSIEHLSGHKMETDQLFGILKTDKKTRHIFKGGLCERSV